MSQPKSLFQREVDLQDQLSAFEREDPEGAALLGYYANHELVGYAHLNHVCENGKKVDLRRRPYARRWWERAHLENHRVNKGCVQSGKTEELTCETLWHAEEGRPVIYVMPNNTLKNLYVQNRVDKTIKRSEHYRKMSRGADGSSQNMSQKHFGSGVIRYVGAQMGEYFKEFPAKVLVIDEYDESEIPGYLPMAFDRLASEENEGDVWTRLCGNPTIEGVGIDLKYQESDQLRYRVPCGHCRRSETLDWHRDFVRQVDEGDFEPLDPDWTPESGTELRCYCPFCGKPKDRLAAGDWSAEFPSRTTHGYEFSKLFTRYKSRDLAIMFFQSLGNATKMRNFYNSYLGLAFTSSGYELTETELRKLTELKPYDAPLTATGTTMGVDVGTRRLHVRISDYSTGIRRLIAMLEVPMEPGMPGLDMLMKVFGVRLAVVDSLPERASAKAFCQRWYGRAMMVEYSKAENISGYKVKEEDGISTITVGRTELLDDTTQSILRGSDLLPRNADALLGGDFFKQMTALVRVYDDSRKVPCFIYRERRDSHCFHATSYDLLAARIDRGYDYSDVINQQLLPNAPDQIPDNLKSLLEMNAPGRIASMARSGSNLLWVDTSRGVRPVSTVDDLMDRHYNKAFHN